MGSNGADEVPVSPRRQVLTLQYGSVEGKVEREINVAMPRSWAELQHTAAQHFGHGGCLRLYHQGTSLLYHPMQLKELHDGDFVTVWRTNVHRPVTPADTPKVHTTTFQASFKSHSSPRPKVGVGNDRQSCLGDASRMEGANMAGMSRYASDFLKPPPTSPRGPFKPEGSIVMGNEPMGVTTYSREFAFYKDAVDKNRADISLRESSFSLVSPRSVFAACSSYATDYSRPPQSARQAVAETRPTSSKPEPTEFSGMTTYNSNYLNCGADRQCAILPTTHGLAISTEAFVGDSEYRNKYHEQPLDWR